MLTTKRTQLALPASCKLLVGVTERELPRSGAERPPVQTIISILIKDFIHTSIVAKWPRIFLERMKINIYFMN